MLATIKQHCGDLDRVKRAVRIFGMVNSAPNLERQPFVIDGGWDLFLELWGPVNGQHARSAVGMAAPPPASRSRSTASSSCTPNPRQPKPCIFALEVVG